MRSALTWRQAKILFVAVVGAALAAFALVAIEPKGAALVIAIVIILVAWGVAQVIGE